LSTENSNKGLVASQIFAGIGIGLLVGIIVGLSVSPVVKIILGALAGLLAAFLGLQDSIFSKQKEETAKVNNRMKMSGLRSGSFGLACVVGILFGIVMRTNEILTISVKEQVGRWVQAGYDSSTARDLVVYQRLKIAPDSTRYNVIINTDSSSGMASTARIDASAGFLYSKEDMQNFCSELSPESYNNSISNTLEAWDGKTTQIVNLSSSIKKLSSEGKHKMIYSIVALMCELGETGTDYDDFCARLKKEIN